MTDPEKNKKKNIVCDSHFVLKFGPGLEKMLDDMETTLSKSSYPYGMGKEWNF